MLLFAAERQASMSSSLQRLYNIWEPRYLKVWQKVTTINNSIRIIYNLTFITNNQKKMSDYTESDSDYK
jgi:hypothetical protein